MLKIFHDNFYSRLVLRKFYSHSCSSGNWLPSLVEKCSSIRQLENLHAQIIVRGYSRDIIILSKLVSCVVGSLGNVHYAYNMFERMPQRNRHMYNTLIRGFLNDQQSEKAISLYREMVYSGIFPNEFTFPFILKACASQNEYLEGVLVHVRSLKSGFSDSFVCVQNGLINLYVSYGMIECARKVFNGAEIQDSVSWSSIIGGYSKMGQWKETFLLFLGMKEAGFELSGHTLVSLLSLCSMIYDVELGRYVHWNIEIFGIDADIYVQNALFDMYAKCGYLAVAVTIFERMVNKNVVSWTSMVSAYAKHGFVELAETVFNQMPVRNVVSWNSIISCHIQHGHYKKSLDFFYKMCKAGFVPDETTIISVLSACTHLGDLDTGKKLHAYVHENKFKSTVTLSNTLVDMYARCGSTETALDLFHEMSVKNIVSWNIIIKALALHGLGHKVIELFKEMETTGIRPDAITFTGLLSACCHCGFIEIGRYFFNKMSQVYNIPHDIEHYSCMIDILGRGGYLDEALELVGKMALKPDIFIWGALLGACKIHRNVMVAKLILKQILELETNTGGLYVLMSNIFCEANRWDEMKKLWKLMKDCGMKKFEALSSIEINGCISHFTVDDMKHHNSDIINNVLNQLTNNMKSERYASFSVHEDVYFWEIHM